MTEFLQQLINGISLGSIYALIALGYTMVYGVLKFINFAHSDVAMIGAYVGFYAAPLILPVFPQPFGGLLVMIVAMTICSILGVVIEKLAYAPLRNAANLTVLITAIGVSLFLEYSGQLIFSADPQPFPELITNFEIIRFGEIVITFNEAIVLFTAVFLMFVLQLIVMKTKLGTAIRAVSFNKNAASLMGINTSVIISFTFALGSALAGAAGILYSLTYPSIDPLMGVLPGLKAFIAAVLGGIGNIPGAMFGGVIIGIVETFTVGYISPTYRDAIAFAILILILIFKPTGLFGTKQKEKV
ncbi:branched-chain amino acid ABC transporter permease [bacterium]|nr:branched-chain amino acid ABC transporter permease [bacterium]